MPVELLFEIYKYLSINVVIKITLFSKNIPNNLIDQYCNYHNILPNVTQPKLNIIKYFNNSTFNLKCYNCSNTIENQYYLVVCVCAATSLKTKNVIYPKFHINCICSQRISTSHNISIYPCILCNKIRILLKCNIYS